MPPSGHGSARGGAVTRPAPDPTVETLLPASSTGRNVALAVAAVVVLVGAWWSPTLLRPELAEWSGGTWGVTPVDRAVVATGEVRRTAWPGVTLVRVRDTPGAHVTGAWLTDGPDELRAPSPTETADQLVARLQAGPLPAGLADDSGRLLVIAWEITDCTLLAEDVAPELELRGALGTTAPARLDPMFGPAYDLSLLEEQGICPGGTDPSPPT